MIYHQLVAWKSQYKVVCVAVMVAMPLILALRKQKKVGLYKFKSSLVYTGSSRLGRAIE